MKKNIRKKLYFVLLIICVCVAIRMGKVDVCAVERISANVSGNSYAYTVTPALTDATYDYLNEIYRDKYPDLGIGYLYGSNADQQIINRMTQKIIANCRTNKEKAVAITKWVEKNIEYKSYQNGTYYYPIDVFYHRTGNCLGRSELMVQMMRLAGVPAVLCVGTRGNMVTTMMLKNIEIDHAWVMAYCDDDWYLFDANFQEYGSNNRDYISKWYFLDDVEGVAPLFDKVLYPYVGYDERAIYYINGRFLYYVKGVPASEYYGTAAEGGMSLQGCISFFAKGKYGTYDGFQYLDHPERKEPMINDESYSNGFITYGSALYYAKPNGILASNQFLKKDGKTYFCSFDGTMLEVQSNTTDYTTIEGYIAIHKGIDQIKMIPTWVEDERSGGKVIVWESLTPEIATVDQNGNITILKEGLATFGVCSKDTIDPDSHYMYSFVQFYVTKEGYRTYSYEDSLNVSAIEKRPSGFLSTPVVGTKVWDKKKTAIFAITSTSKKSPTVAYVKPQNKKAVLIKVPGTVKIANITYKVTSIASGAFKNNSKVKKIIVHSNVTKIGKNAFKGCKKLKTLTIQSKKLIAKSISKDAFRGISSKTTIKVPKGKARAYKALFRKKGLSKKVVVK